MYHIYTSYIILYIYIYIWYIYIYIIYIYVYIYIYIYHIYIYTHTHIHTYVRTYIHTYITLHYLTLHYITFHYITYIHTHYIYISYISRWVGNRTSSWARLKTKKLLGAVAPCTFFDQLYHIFFRAKSSHLQGFVGLGWRSFFTTGLAASVCQAPA